MSSVAVAVRVRPFNSRELKYDSRLIINMEGSIEGGNAYQVTTIKPVRQGKIQDSEPPRRFTFDYCFWTHDQDGSNGGNGPQYADQTAVYNSLGKNILNNCLTGYNSTLFAYGQTGSGKTYTMMGVPSDPGVIPRLCSDLFQYVVSHKETTFKIECTYMEIYNEQVRDLLNPSSINATLKVRQHPKLGTFVEGLTRLTVKDADEISKLLDEGNSVRSVAATNMNAHSSRSHAILTLHVRSATSDAEGTVKEIFSSLNLVDLAGSERATSTGAQGQTLAEGANINKSLTTLGMCLSRLAEHAEGKKGGHVPFRDSQLTWLLSDSLGGNSKTCMLAALSPADINADETMSTLRFAETTKKIKQHAVVNEDPQQRLIRELKSEIDQVKSQIKAFEEGSMPMTVSDGSTKSKAELLQDLVDSTELFQNLTESEEEKQMKEKMIRKKREQALAKLKDNNKIPVNTLVPRLHVLNEDMHRFPDISLLYYISEGTTYCGSKAAYNDEKVGVYLKLKKAERSAVAAPHCRISCDALKRVVTIEPVVGNDSVPETYVNGELLTKDSGKELKHLDRIIIGPIVFRHALPAAWQIKEEDGSVEFNRDPVDDTHAHLLGDFDELAATVQKFNDNVKSQGEAAALKIQPNIRELKSRLSEIESALVMDYPLDEASQAGTSLEQALTYDVHFALKERDRVKALKQQQAQSDETIAALLNELDASKAADAELEAKYEAQKRNDRTKEDRTESGTSGGQQDRAAVEDGVLLAELDDVLDASKKDEKEEEPQPSSSQHVDPTSQQIPIDPLRYGKELELRRKAAGIIPDEYDEAAPVKIGKSDAGSSSTLNMKAALARELLAYEDQVSLSQQWSPDGPRLMEDRPEWSKWSAKNTTKLQEILTKGAEGRIVKKGSGLFKLRVKQSMFHKGGFHPVYAVLRGRFFYYFDNNQPNCGNLGSAHLYGAQIYTHQPPQEGKEWIMKIVPTVPRKPTKSNRGITEENNLVLGFESESLMMEWYSVLHKATLPPMSDALARWFGQDNAPPVVTDSDVAANKGEKKRLQTHLKSSDAAISLTGDDKSKLEHYQAAEEQAEKVTTVVDDNPVQIVVAADALSQLEHHAIQQHEDVTAVAAKATFVDDTAQTKSRFADELPAELVEELEFVKVPAQSVHNPKFLKYYFHASREGDKQSKAGNRSRMWLVDHFSKTVELLDLKQKKATIYKAKQILVVEKHNTDSCRLHISFFHHGYHPHNEHFLTPFDRDRFFETLQAIRPAIRVFCPSLVVKKDPHQPDSVETGYGIDSITPISAEGENSIEVFCGQEKKTMRLEGTCYLRVSKQVHESLSVWTGTLNLSGFPLQSREILENWIPIGRYDLYAITVQEASYRTTQNQFFDFVAQTFGKDFTVVAQMELYDVLLIVVTRRRLLLKISNIEGSTCPSSIESLSGERGGIGISMKYLETSFCFIAVHLPSTPGRQDLRRFMLNEILTNLQLGDKSVDLSSQFDFLYLLGDFSFSMAKSAVVDRLEEACSSGNFTEFVSKFDSLQQEREKKKILVGFSEAKITFPPTYPVEIGTENYNTGKSQTPSYPNRIFLRSANGAGNSPVTVVGYKAIRRIKLSEQIPLSASFLVNCVRPIASCFINTKLYSDDAIGLTVSHVRIHKSLNCKKPALYISSPTLFQGKHLDSETCAFPPEGGYAWSGISDDPSKSLVFPLTHMVEEYHDRSGSKFFVSILDLAEADPAQQQKGTAVVPLQGALKHGRSSEGGLECVQQRTEVAFHKNGRIITQCTVTFSWEPLADDSINQEADDDV